MDEKKPVIEKRQNSSSHKLEVFLGHDGHSPKKIYIPILCIISVMAIGVFIWKTEIKCAVDGCTKPRESGSIYCSIHSSVFSAKARSDAQLNHKIQFYQNQGNTEDAGTSESPENRNALEGASKYLSFTNFSKKGLQEQLEYEGYSTSAAQYAVNHCGADWNEQAAGKARSYMDMSSFSKSALIKQLEFEGFTHSQAEYGAKSVGY